MKITFEMDNLGTLTVAPGTLSLVPSSDGGTNLVFGPLVLLGFPGVSISVPASVPAQPDKADSKV
jgi:hypothetical protein